MKLRLPVGGGRTGEEIVREFSMDMYTLLYLDWITNKDLLYIAHRTLLSIMGCLDGRGVWGRMDTFICRAETLGCPPETITTLLISYRPGLQHCRQILHQLSHTGKPNNTGVGSLSLLQGIFETQ